MALDTNKIMRKSEFEDARIDLEDIISRFALNAEQREKIERCIGLMRMLFQAANDASDRSG